jgi:hypothetical protein
MKRTTICLLVVAAFSRIATAQAPAARALSPVWSLAGSWTGVVGDEKSGAIYTTGYDRGAEVDITGHMRREFRLPAGRQRTLRLGRFPRATLVTFTTWGGTGVNAYDLRGNRLWSYPDATGIDDVWTGDLDGDNSDEVVVGYNGSAGLHVVDGKGQLRWKSTAIGNVWHVTVGDVFGQGKPQVVVTSLLTSVHIFDGNGSGRVDVATRPVFAHMVRVQKRNAEDATATMLVAGHDYQSNTSAVLAISGDGASKWRLELPGIVHTADAASAFPWLALGTREGRVFVVDTARGEIVGGAIRQGHAEVGWALATSTFDHVPSLHQDVAHAIPYVALEFDAAFDNRPTGTAGFLELLA